MKIVVRIAAVAAAVVLMLATLDAQRRNVRGRVTDATGAAVPGITVELIRNGEVVRTATTAADGQFALEVIDLSEGRFEVRVTASGFAAATLTLSPEAARSELTIGPFRAE